MIKLSQFVPPIILWMSIGSVMSFIDIINVNVYIDYMLTILIITILMILPSYSNDNQKLYFINGLLIWYVFSIIRGLFIAETYWDWKGLAGNGFAMLLIAISLTGVNIHMVRAIYVFYLKFTLPLFLILIFLIPAGAFGLFLAPLSPLILFLPLFKFRWKITILFLALIVIIGAASARSNVIKFMVPLLILFFYYFRAFKLKGWMNVGRNILFVMPFILLVLALNGTFNVFKMDEYIKSDLSSTVTRMDGSKVKESLIADTRTLLYVEVLQTAAKYNSWWIGRSPARGNESKLFGKIMKSITGRAERLGNEVAILNVFTWTGLIGVIFYFLIFYQASYLAMNKSNNIFSKMLGLYIAFRWFYAWLEDINYFTLTTFVLWLMIGVCYSKSFRKMTDLEVKLWVRGIAFKKEGNNILVLK